MNSIKILHTGDLHLSSMLNNIGEKAIERRQELLETFSNILKLADSENVDALLISGDLFENNNPDEVTCRFICDGFEKIKNIKVFIVRGNHDYNVRLNYPENVYVFENYIDKVTVGNVDIYGVSFEEERCDRCIIEGFTADNSENINLLLVHGDLQSNSLYNPISLQNIKYSNMDYVALGHIHSYNGFFTVGSTTYSYCGIPEGRGFDECGEKGVIIAEVGKGYVKGEFVPLCSRKYVCKNVDVTGLEDNIAIAEEILNSLCGTENAYQITLTGEKNNFVDTAFLKEYLEKEIYYVEINDNSTVVSCDEYSLKNLFLKNCPDTDAKKYGIAALRGEKVIIE